ncbi:MAG: helix-turn-helix transcriptional regulator [Cyclobacteriaceae bacterium]|nr:helix-turn-helix transcriptional regulator [Cyclobacteriaceae bacterium]
MEDYNKIIESLGIKYNKSKNIKIIQAVSNDNYYDVENTIFIVHLGELRYGADKQKVKKGEILLVPGGKSISISYGNVEASTVTKDKLISRKESFLQSIDYAEIATSSQENFSYITFEAKVFDSVNFFASLDIPPFIIKSRKISDLIYIILEESESEAAGHERIVKALTEYLVVEITRYIIDNQLFVEKLATNITYFKDPRLIDIFTFIKENLQGDLSNKVLSNVANVSEDYVGQYFKMLTGINPQDYIEYQRMEMAVNLLRTSKKSIREIGKEVGYKDTAYFCRRFKMMFGIPAGKMRRRESLMNI